MQYCSTEMPPRTVSPPRIQKNPWGNGPGAGVTLFIMFIFQSLCACHLVQFLQVLLSLVPIGHDNTYGNLGEVTNNNQRLSDAAVRRPEIDMRLGPHAKVRMAVEPKP